MSDLAQERAGEAAESLPQPQSAGRIDRLLDVLSSPFYVRSIATSAILLLAVCYTLVLAQAIIMPIAAAVVLQFVVAPIHRTLVRLRLPEAAAAAVIVVGLIGAVMTGVYYLSGPVASWVERVPQIVAQVQEKVRVLRVPIEQVQRASKQVEEATDVSGSDGAPEVTVRQSSLLPQVIGGVSSFFASIGLVLLLTFFMLASGDLFKLKLVRVIPRFEDKKRAVSILREIEHNVSTYLFTITLINIALGCAIGFSLHLIGMPNAVLWGVMAAFLNYIPYIGSLVGIAVVAMVSTITFDEITYAMLAPAAYGILTTVEGHLLTPAVLGRSLTLNSVVIIINLVLWGWLWGVPGALLAGPFLIIVKVLCDHIEPLGAIAEFLSARRT